MEAVNIYPVLISWKETKNNEVPIAIRYDFHNKRVGHERVPYKINPKDWDPEKREVRKSNQFSALINQVIAKRLLKAKQYFLQRNAFDLPINPEIIKKYITAGGAADSFYLFAVDVIQNKKLKDGKPYSPDTKRRYNDEVKRMKKYREELQFREITVQFLTSYKLWLQNDYRKKDKGTLDKNSIWKALAFIRMVYNEAMSKEIILKDNNPFSSFEVGSYEDDPDSIKFLEINEVDDIENTLKTKKDSMEELTLRIGWRFLSMCVSGMRISDAMKLNDGFFNDAGDLQFKPHKTRRYNNVAQIPITTDRQRRYFEQTINLPLPETDPKSFRTTFNIHLKILAAMAGINKNITSHVGRHTLGSLLVDAGVENKPAMAMLGIKSPKVLETYAKLKQSKLRDEANKLGNVM